MLQNSYPIWEEFANRSVRFASAIKLGNLHLKKKRKY